MGSQPDTTPSIVLTLATFVQPEPEPTPDTPPPAQQTQTISKQVQIKPEILG